MHNLGLIHLRPPASIFWCPACGTLKENYDNDSRGVAVPRLAEHMEMEQILEAVAKVGGKITTNPHMNEGIGGVPFTVGDSDD
jgi:hypothetical protein